MKLSVFYDHIREGAEQRGVPLSQALCEVRAAGVERVELDLDAVSIDPKGLRAALQSAGLQAGGLYGFFDFGHKKQADRARALLDRAADMGARYVLAVPGFLEPGDDEAVCLARMDESLQGLCAEAATRGITVLMEDFDSAAAPYATSRQLRRFLDAVPSLFCALDTGNFLYSGEDMLDAFPLLADRIRYVHLKDRARTPRPGEKGIPDAKGRMLYSASVGTGVIPMAECLRRLFEFGYDGTLAIEHFGSPDQLGDIERSAAFVLAQL